MCHIHTHTYIYIFIHRECNTVSRALFTGTMSVIEKCVPECQTFLFPRAFLDVNMEDIFHPSGHKCCKHILASTVLSKVMESIHWNVSLL